MVVSACGAGDLGNTQKAFQMYLFRDMIIRQLVI